MYKPKWIFTFHSRFLQNYCSKQQRNQNFFHRLSEQSVSTASVNFKLFMVDFILPLFTLIPATDVSIQTNFTSFVKKEIIAGFHKIGGLSSKNLSSKLYLIAFCILFFAFFNFLILTQLNERLANL